MRSDEANHMSFLQQQLRRRLEMLMSRKNVYIRAIEKTFIEPNGSLIIKRYCTSRSHVGQRLEFSHPLGDCLIVDAKRFNSINYAKAIFRKGTEGEEKLNRFALCKN
jgi:hypothetical protein